MKVHNLVQGSPEWHAFRAQHWPASEAPAMLGVSKYKTRTQLLKERKTGIAAEVDAQTQRLFDDGHRFEALARPIAEQIAGTEFFPVTGSEGKFSASFDGIDMLETICFEHKTLNDEIRQAQEVHDLHPQYLVQMEQQLMVSGATKCLFLATKWNGDKLEEKKHFWYESDKDLARQIAAGWEQFARDLEAFEVEAEQPKAVGKAPDTLPSLLVQVSGQVSASNLSEFKDAALVVLNGINTDLQNDQDFANAEKTVKWCKDVESRLEAAKENALAQTASIDELFRTIDAIKEETRQKRLVLEKSVKTKKEEIKSTLVADAVKAYTEFCKKHVQATKITAPAVNFGECIRGLKTLDSMKNALATELANKQVVASQFYDDVKAKLDWIDEINSPVQLFDLAQLVLKPMEDMQATVKQRIADHQHREDARKAQELANQQAKNEAKPVAVATPIKTDTPKATYQVKSRPTDTEIIDALCLHFRVHQSKVVEWLCEMDLSDPALIAEA